MHKDIGFYILLSISMWVSFFSAHVWLT